jgi:hypothetical protein
MTLFLAAAGSFKNMFLWDGFGYVKSFLFEVRQKPYLSKSSGGLRNKFRCSSNTVCSPSLPFLVKCSAHHIQRIFCGL